MKTETFVELFVSTWHPCGGIWGELTLINMSQVVKVARDKNWCRVFLKNGKDFLCSESYEETMKRIERA